MPAPVPTEKLTDAYKTALRRFSQVEADDPMLLGNLATSMGACRLFGVDLGSIDCTLTVEQGVVVAGSASRLPPPLTSSSHCSLPFHPTSTTDIRSAPPPC
jgi:hypothetical protein